MESSMVLTESSKWKLGGIATFCVAGFLLLSMGGAIIAAPLTVPLMFVAMRRHPSRGFRIAGAVLIGLTIAEVAWALTYVAISEAKPWIWLLPLVAGGAAIAMCWSRTAPHARRAITHA
jgi:hypothetical protein